MGHQVYYQSSWDMREIEAGIDYYKPDLLITVGIDKPVFNPALNVIPALCEKIRTAAHLLGDGRQNPFRRHIAAVCSTHQAGHRLDHSSGMRTQIPRAGNGLGIFQFCS